MHRLFFYHPFIVFFFFAAFSFGQQPTVGEQMPDFTLTTILNYKSTQANLKDFKGRWLILDFWESGCIPCIKKFPEINNFQAHFKDRIQFVLVGAADKTIKESNWNNMPALVGLYDRISKKQDLNLVNAYDSVLSDKWKFHSFPTIYIIDPEGVLRYITEGRNMSVRKLQLMLDGGKVDFSLKMDERQSFDDNGILRSVRKDSSVIYFSFFKKFEKESYDVSPIDLQIRLMKGDSNYSPMGYTVAGAPLSYLYNVAYIGYPSLQHAFFLKPEYIDIYYPLPLLEIKDKSPFLLDKKEEQGLFNYALKVPRSQFSVERMMQIMQGDLKNCFGYSVEIEDREMPVWNFVANSKTEKLLKTKGGKVYTRDEGTSGGSAGFIWRNISGKLLIESVTRYMDDIYEIPYVDKTGIDYNVDIEIDADMSNSAQVRLALQKYGLDIVKGTRIYKVIVIKD